MEKRNWTKVLLSVMAVIFIYCFNFNTLNAQAEMQGTEEPIVETHQLVNGDLYLKFIKPNDDLYIEGTLLNIESYEYSYYRTYTLNALGEVIIPNKELQVEDFEVQMTLREGQNYNSPDFYAVFPKLKEKTVVPWMISSSQKGNGDMEIKIYKSFSTAYEIGTKINIEGIENDYYISGNEIITISNQDLPNQNIYATIQVTEPGKAPNIDATTILYHRK